MTDQRRARADEYAEQVSQAFIDEPNADFIDTVADKMLAFADAERKAERERCAKVCRDYAYPANIANGDNEAESHNATCNELAESIDKLGD